MRFSGIYVASLVAAPLVAAHGGIPGAPKVFGVAPNEVAKLKNRDIFSGQAKRDPEQGPTLNARQGGQNGRCGPSFGGASCAAGYCCSGAGWCGQGNDYCEAPDCLFPYGPGCDANKTPSGTSTRNVARPQLGDIEYGGEGIYACEVPGTVAITYDDGPYIYTNGVLDQFKAYGAKATFFITGINIGKGAIDDASTAWPAVIRRMEAEGHQIASHTWSHQDLSAITKEQRYDQMVKNEMAFKNIIGKFPTYMRPPYSSCTAASGCQQDLKDLGYVVSYFDLDTDDYNNITPALIQNAKNRVSTALQGKTPTNDDFLAIAHDIHQQTAQNLTGYMLEQFTQKGFKLVTMGECMGDPKANWYRTGSGGSTPTTTTTRVPTSSPTGKVSTDGSCGGTNGFTCKGSSFGNCCSQYGWCGSTVDHCGTGCNPSFGTCGSSSNTPTTTTATRPPTSTPTNKVISNDGTCGGTGQMTCKDSPFGNCCSQYGWCGSTTDHCGTGCQSAFGTCGSPVSSLSSIVPDSDSSSTPPPSSPSPSSPSTGGNTFSSLTSVNSAPSSTTNPPSLTTSVRPSSTSTAAPSPTSNVSKNGRCGARNSGQTCKGYANGSKPCCRWDGTCGSGLLACGLGCMNQFGDCWWS
ncbi:carbohydrate esterase family 4 protein [Aaosphaeria arxii CBS 175.79]|uniref:Carbohydrate esterase family 4 protein n=1 Tax=Aaosphaeria arxii CBS 175.79 TaxID=1450172 RepID=A0A6A5Y2N9_9PLEO|nr:carbohydrate esterase family 4 protein [Aaosphaeria arxii CBS 175.79]KAF2019070.1 carbohydrate esterase family 4 protein [Aaosphaeria arxii CBS 175.79]